MNIIFVALISVFHLDYCVSAPARESRDVLVIPARFNPPFYSPFPYVQTRGPFDFIGNWIQSSEWFPIEINVPDTLSGIGNGIGTFATNVGNGFNTFTQNLGTGIQSFTQNVGNNAQTIAQNLSQRFPVLAVLVRPTAPPKYFALIPSQNIDNNKGTTVSVREIDSDLLESFP